jgi:cell division protein FtsL
MTTTMTIRVLYFLLATTIVIICGLLRECSEYYQKYKTKEKEVADMNEQIRRLEKIIDSLS